MRLATIILLGLCTLLGACQTDSAGGLVALSSARPDDAAEEKFIPETVSIAPTQKVDIYRPDKPAGGLFALAAKQPEKPVVLYVHGGGWIKGDRDRVYHLPAWAKERGYVLVSIDYRPVPKTNIDGQVSDVVRAINWTRNHITTYGGDPSRIVIMGHSAGSHLVSMVAAKKLGGDIRGVVANDVQAYDLAEYYRLRNNSHARVYRAAFGTNRADWARWSPMTWVKQNSGFPPFLILHSRSDGERRKKLANHFAVALRAKGTLVTVFDGKNYTHGSIASRIGRSAEVTRAVDRFVAAVVR